MTFGMPSRCFLNKCDMSWKYPAKIFVRRSIFHRKSIYRSIEVNLEVLRSGHIKTTEFRSRCCFCVHHEKRTDKLSVRQQSIYCVKNARNALLRKHCMLWLGIRKLIVSYSYLEAWYGWFKYLVTLCA